MDYRAKECRKIRYPDDLLVASVVIIFTDEAWSPLMRTVHSVINRTPLDLLQEIVLVDDFSQRGMIFIEYFNFFSQNPNRVYFERSPEKLLGNI